MQKERLAKSTKYDWAVFFLIYLFVFIHVSDFVLGYGGLEMLLGIMTLLSSLILIAICIYDLFLFLRIVYAAIKKRWSPYIGRCLVLTGTLCLFFVLRPVIPVSIRHSVATHGATLRLKDLGGEIFCERLRNDALKLTDSARDDSLFLSQDQMPESFRHLSGGGALIRHAKHEDKAVHIMTGIKPYLSEWIVVPKGSTADIKALKIEDGIYRTIYFGG